ncbi:hypothetical protein CEXT_512021 [Caerostris extrusa]|uniref:Uncharacterized protein n=1 Tax=Caerostris extrusa TaxID=172846 RepID=A0AAV4TQ85_CAEEX|nr:hypothetical protein CEXT_512021 [Caerostris extrusa]
MVKEAGMRKRTDLSKLLSDNKQSEARVPREVASVFIFSRKTTAKYLLEERNNFCFERVNMIYLRSSFTEGFYNPHITFFFTKQRKSCDKPPKNISQCCLR